MLWWLLLRNKTTRNLLGSVVDLCAYCARLRYFRVVRVFSSSALGGGARQVSDEKWCAGCGRMTRCNPLRYVRPLADVELQPLSEQQAFAATNPGLQSRLGFLEQFQAAAEAELDEAQRAVMHKALASLKRFESAGQDTTPLLQRMDVSKPRRAVEHLADQLRAEEAKRVMTDEARAAEQRAVTKSRWQMLGSGAVAGLAAAMLAWLPRAMSPWFVIGSATALALLGAVVMGFVLEARTEERLTALVPALVIALAGSATAWFTHTRSLYLDNPTVDPLVVFINGKRHDLDAGAHPKIYIEKADNYRLGWALRGGRTPIEAFDTPIDDEAIYNPGSTACYWLQIDVYSVSETEVASDSEPWGPQPVRKLYMFDKVDNWFELNPDTVQLSSGSSTARRTAVLYDNECMRFVPCDISIRQQLQTCRAAAARVGGDAAVDACTKRAEERCPEAEPPLDAPL